MRGASFGQHFLGLAEIIGGHAVLSLEHRIKIGYRRETDAVAYGNNGFIRILQLKGRMLQADIIQVIGHGTAHVMLESPAHIGFAEMVGRKNLIQTGL